MEHIDLLKSAVERSVAQLEEAFERDYAQRRELVALHGCSCLQCHVEDALSHDIPSQDDAQRSIKKRRESIATATQDRHSGINMDKLRASLRSREPISHHNHAMESCLFGDELPTFVLDVRVNVEERNESEFLHYFRVYLHSAYVNDYEHVGWVVSQGVDRCMACCQPFSSGFFFSLGNKHHCRACGDLVCDACSRLRTVDLLVELGPQRVCTRCCEESGCSSSSSSAQSLVAARMNHTAGQSLFVDIDPALHAKELLWLDQQEEEAAEEIREVGLNDVGFCMSCLHALSPTQRMRCNMCDHVVCCFCASEDTDSSFSSHTATAVCNVCCADQICVEAIQKETNVSCPYFCSVDPIANEELIAQEKQLKREVSMHFDSLLRDCPLCSLELRNDVNSDEGARREDSPNKFCMSCCVDQVHILAIESSSCNSLSDHFEDISAVNNDDYADDDDDSSIHDDTLELTHSLRW